MTPIAILLAAILGVFTLPFVALILQSRQPAAQSTAALPAKGTTPTKGAMTSVGEEKATETTHTHPDVDVILKAIENEDAAIDKPSSLPTQSLDLIPSSPTPASTAVENQISAAVESTPQLTFRKWTSADGKFSTEAEFRGSIGGKVKLRKPDGVVLTVDEQVLSDDDRERIRNRAKK